MDRLTRSRAARRRGGFTLIEVMVALAILASGLLAAAAVQLHSPCRAGRAGGTPRTPLPSPTPSSRTSSAWPSTTRR